MNKLLVISGPTATGKTAIAVKIAKKYNGELISADSRQIYKGLEIGVGKDHPKGTPIHLIDIINPDQTYSAAEFRGIALEKIKEIQSRNKLPILVGCSGFYVDAVINSQPTFSIKPNKLLRFILNYLPLKILQFGLWSLDFGVYSKLNNSDVNNPHRLIRKIEIKLSKLFFSSLSREGAGVGLVLHLSLTAPNSVLYPRIDARVDERLGLGHLDELKSLLKRYTWSSPGLKVSAYQVFRFHFSSTTSIEECVHKWKYLEHRDARRQKTWFKSRENIRFYDISNPKYPGNILDFVAKWYNKV